MIEDHQGFQPPVETTPDAKTWGLLCHISALSGYVVPLGSVLGPLVVWLIKKDQYPFVDEQGKESLNFQISMLVYMLASIPLIFVFVGFFLVVGLAVIDLVFVILATVAASRGESYRYPLTIRFIK